MSYRILLVDDEPHVIRILRLTLEREGYQVRTANDGNEALGVMADYQPHVMISDIQMAGMDGQELCTTARALSGAPFPDTGDDIDDGHRSARLGRAAGRYRIF